MQHFENPNKAAMARHADGPANREPERVEIYCKDFLITGTVYTSKTDKKNRRLTMLLNEEKRFLVVTDANLQNWRTQTQLRQDISYLQINLHSIDFILPM